MIDSSRIPSISISTNQTSSYPTRYHLPPFHAPFALISLSIESPFAMKFDCSFPSDGDISTIGHNNCQSKQSFLTNTLLPNNRTPTPGKITYWRLPHIHLCLLVPKPRQWGRYWLEALILKHLLTTWDLISQTRLWKKLCYKLSECTWTTINTKCRMTPHIRYHKAISCP